jgi:hypothetical protein
MNIPKHVIDKIIPCKTLKKLIWNGLPRIKFITITSFKFFKNKKTYIRKISMHFINQFFIWWCFIFYFDTTLMYFLSPHFSFSLCDKCNVVISKVHYESRIFLKFIQFFFVMIPIKVYDNMNNWKIDNGDFDHALNFTFVCNLE